MVLASTPANVEAATYSPVFYYYHADHLGSSNVLTDRVGNLVQHYENTTFGKASYQNNTSASPITHRYTGQILDDTGLYFYNARYYDAELGRFVQPDTIVPGATNPQSLNRYSYCGNDPINNSDPSGHGGAGSFLGGLLQAKIDTVSDPKTWAGVAAGAAGGALVGSLGGPYGTAVGAGVGAGYALMGALWVHMAAYTTGYIFGPEAGRIAGMAVAIAFAAYGIADGVGMIGSQNDLAWTEIGSAALSIGSATAGYAGESTLSEAFGYASMATSIAGAGEYAFDGPSASPQGPTDEYYIGGVGERGSEDVISGHGTVGDIGRSSIERFGLTADNLDSAVSIYSSIIRNNNEAGISTVFDMHSQGALLGKIMFGKMQAAGVDLGSTYARIIGSPISKIEFAGVINLSHVTAINHFLDPVHNIFGAPWNPVQSAFGIATLPFTLSQHAIAGYSIH